MRDDQQLVDGTIAGDRAAFETLVERHSGVVYRVAARIVGTQDADDELTGVWPGD